MKALYKLHFDCGRSGTLYGSFIAEKEEIQKLIESGQEIQFGEVLGKHSDVYGPLGSTDITFVTDDQKFLKLFEKHDLEMGYNPLDYI